MPNLPESASRTSRSNFTLPVATSRRLSTGGLFLLTSRMGRAPAISWRARFAASSTRAKRLSTIGRQSSTVTRAMDYLEMNGAAVNVRVGIKGWGREGQVLGILGL